MSSRRLRSHEDMAARRTEEVFTTPPSLHEIVMSWGTRQHFINDSLRLHQCSIKTRISIPEDYFHWFQHASVIMWRAMGIFTCNLEGWRRACLIRGTIAGSKVPLDSEGSNFTSMFCKKALLGPAVLDWERILKLMFPFESWFGLYFVIFTFGVYVFMTMTC